MKYFLIRPIFLLISNNLGFSDKLSEFTYKKLQTKQLLLIIFG